MEGVLFSVYPEEVLDKCFFILHYIGVKEFLNMNVILIAVALFFAFALSDELRMLTFIDFETNIVVLLL